MPMTSINSDGNGLDRAEATFAAKRLDWISEGHEGQWAAVCGETLVGFFATFELAFIEGKQKCGDTAFLVKQLLRVEHPETLQRVFW